MKNIKCFTLGEIEIMIFCHISAQGEFLSVAGYTSSDVVDHVLVRYEIRKMIS